MSTSIEERLEEMKSPKTFNARAAVKKTTYPVDKVDVYADAEAAHEVNILANDAVKARYGAQLIWDKAKANALEVLAAGATAVSEDPEDEAKAIADNNPQFIEADKEASALEAELAAALIPLRSTMLTFHLRGLAPAQWRNIHKLGRKEIKEPVRKNFEKGEDGDEEFQLATLERNIERNNWVNNASIASSIIKVVNPDGEEDTSVWTTEDVADLFDHYLESEYGKLKDMMEQLTYANNLFQVAVQQDVDFLANR